MSKDRRGKKDKKKSIKEKRKDRKEKRDIKSNSPAWGR